MTALQAIRVKCVECNCGSAAAVRKCEQADCPLFPYRFGHNPNRTGKGGFAAKNAHTTGDSENGGEQEC